MHQLDLKDRKLLYYLDLNSRSSLNELAKKVGLSKQVVDYRLKRLMKNKIIKQFYTVINFSKLGYTQYKLYLKLQNATVEKEQEILDYWIKSESSVWVASCRGKWDLAVSILAKDINDFGEILSEFANKYGLHILEKDILTTQISPIFTRSYLLEQKEKKRFTYGGKIEEYQLDKTEDAILQTLSTNARIPILEMMNKLSLTRDTINYRLKKLTKDKIISQYRILINLEALGHKLYKIILRFHSLTAEKEREIITYVETHSHGVQYLKLVGSSDTELEFEVESDEQLHKILLEIRNKFSDIIRDYDTLLIKEEHKLNYYPF
ncbi:Lrp/AsnC family transcriptional regulator [Candidatus Woesearchaeota archaeon]|nr:Lrp/AsnC family transcriptional regulator [Candidatus Woesearchaeota archaeon]